MKVKEINSRQNRDFQAFLKILKGQGVKKQGLAFFSGPKQVREILTEFPEHCEGLIFSAKHEMPEGIPTRNLQTYSLSAELFKEVDAFGTNHPVLIVRVPLFPSWDAGASIKGCTLLIPFQDPSNVGAVIRSAAAFGVTKLVMLKEAAHPFHYKSTRAGGSALFRVLIVYGPSIQELGGAKSPIITLSAGGEDIRNYAFPERFCLLPGMEGPGLPVELRHLRSLSIPMERGVESLNASLATGIALYAWRCSIKKG
ncbi:MAG: rRNA ((527)-N(7))-methyltransferase GidB [Deltaproteobacteria bacterium]|nr:rRNA ((527)-N(7))-methyltransferase GidB [Deltaproteobacteria bacterium]